MMNHDDINLPWVVAEVTAAFYRYEDALVSNNVAVLDELFWHDKNTVRLGASENLYGMDEIRAFRAARPSAGLQRTLRHTVITTFGEDYAVCSTEFTGHGTHWPSAADVGAVCLRVAHRGGAGEFDGVTPTGMRRPVGRVRRSRHPAKHGTIISETDAPPASAPQSAGGYRPTRSCCCT